MIQGSLDEIIPTVASHPTRDNERNRIDAAIIADGEAHAGWISANRVREHFTNEHGLTVHSRLLSTRYRVLRATGVIEHPDDWENYAEWRTRSTDVRGRNAGRVMPMYRVVGAC